MANVTFYKSNQQYYYVNSSGTGSQVAKLGGYCIRNNSSMNSWIRTAGFTTGTKRVTKVRVYHVDCNALSYYGSYSAKCGISSSLVSWTSSGVPSCTWTSSGTFTYLKSSDGYNGYYCDIDCDLMPGTTYYIYIWVSSSGGAWDVLTYPLSSSDSRSSRTEVTFTTSTDAGLVRIYNGSSWVSAIPYVYNGSEWKQCIPYVYNGSEWKICT